MQYVCYSLIFSKQESTYNLNLHLFFFYLNKSSLQSHNNYRQRLLKNYKNIINSQLENLVYRKIVLFTFSRLALLFTVFAVPSHDRWEVLNCSSEYYYTIMKWFILPISTLKTAHHLVCCDNIQTTTWDCIKIGVNMTSH